MYKTIGSSYVGFYAVFNYRKGKWVTAMECMKIG